LEAAMALAPRLVTFHIDPSYIARLVTCINITVALCAWLLCDCVGRATRTTSALHPSLCDVPCGLLIRGLETGMQLDLENKKTTMRLMMMMESITLCPVQYKQECKVLSKYLSSYCRLLNCK